MAFKTFKTLFLWGVGLLTVIPSRQPTKLYHYLIEKLLMKSFNVLSWEKYLNAVWIKVWDKMMNILVDNKKTLDESEGKIWLPLNLRFNEFVWKSNTWFSDNCKNLL